MRRHVLIAACLLGSTSVAAFSACGTSTSTTASHDGGTRDAARPVEAGATDAGPPCSDYSSTKNVYWGDLHSHTVLSADAYGWGTRAFPHDAYRFASDPSYAVTIASGSKTPGPKVTIGRPLDFLAVTDHSEWLAATWGCGETPGGEPIDPKSPYTALPACATFRNTTSSGSAPIIIAAENAVAAECDGGGELCPGCGDFTSSAWQVEIQAAHDAYQRCSFTTFVAYEWTLNSLGATLHQNVIFGSENVPKVPFDALDYVDPTDLFSALDRACTAAAGCEALTIPHNSNLSLGMAFQVPSGIDAKKQMNRYQRLAEIHQTKGNSECYAGPDASDPTCAFEHLPPSAGGSEAANNFVRHALEVGLVDYAATQSSGQPSGPDAGTDPLELGIVGGTDDHNATPGAVSSASWAGHVGSNDDTAVLRLTENPTNNPGGLTGVWAEENTRESIFAALSRRETYATSGPRMVLRFYAVYGGDDYCAAGAGGGGFPANVIAAGGVPMGGTMGQPPSGAKSPSFVVSALTDVTDLAEVDVVKAAVIAGRITETIQRFTASSPGTVWSSGSACVRLTDASFDPKSPAFYYARVLEVPTPRWSHYDCQTAPATTGCGADGGLDVLVQQRAWSSPVWWLP
jgi:uncharacterized protein DUF3604